MRPVLLATVFCCFWAGAAAGQGYFFAGQDKTLWLVRAQDDAFDLLARDPSGKWGWLDRDRSGRVVAVAPDRDALHLFFPMGAHQVFSGDLPEGTYGLSIPGHPLGGCPDTRPKESGLIVLAWEPMKPPASVPSTLPTTSLARAAPGEQPEAVAPTVEAATQPGGTGFQPVSSTASHPAKAFIGRPVQVVRVSVYQSGPERWRILGTIDNLTYSADVKLYAAVRQTRVYVMISDTANHRNRLLCLDGARWQDIPLTAESGPVRLASDPVLGMFSVKGRLVFLVQHPEEGGQNVTMHLAKAADPAAAFAWQVLANQGKDLAWPAGTILSASAVGEQAALLTRQGQELPRVALFDLDGRMIQEETLTVLEAKGEDEFSRLVLQYFLWAILIAIFIPLFWGRPGAAPAPFALPEGVRPANLILRLLAGVLDLLPFFTLSALAFPLPQMTTEEVQTIIRQQQFPENVAYVVVTTFTLFVLYCIVMECLFGATLGKMLFHLKVVGDQGQPPTLRPIVLRNLVKIVEILWPIYWPVLVLFPILSRNRQRLGDMLARTAVVDSTTLPRSPADKQPRKRKDF